ncbi:MAG: DNA polymerase III subunit chi [Acidobacteria bacterium]|nr:DNA polymerase III subunit chi [Acidobacteriota bacterium]
MNGCIFHDTAGSPHDRRVFEIVEEAYNRREKVVVFAGSEERAAEIDRFLWILRQDSFIPHQVVRGYEDSLSVPVVIVTTEWNPLDAGTLIADGHCRMEFAKEFEIIHEFVDRSSPEIRDACRDRFRAYRDKNIPVEYLKTGVWKGVIPKN